MLKYRKPFTCIQIVWVVLIPSLTVWLMWWNGPNINKIASEILNVNVDVNAPDAFTVALRGVRESALHPEGADFNITIRS